MGKGVNEIIHNLCSLFTYILIFCVAKNDYDD